MIFWRGFVWALGMGLEAVSAWLLLVENAVVEALAVHVGACFLIVVLGISGKFFHVHLPGVRVWLLAVMVTIPCLGPLSALILLGILLFIPQKIRKNQRVILGLMGGGSVTVDGSLEKARSVLETLASAEPEARREAILALRSEISPSAVLILQKAVGDSDEQVRNFAQSQLAKWTERSEDRIKEFEGLLGTGEVSTVVCTALAEAYLEVVNNHLAGAETEKKYLLNALRVLDKIPTGSPENHCADVLALRCHLRLRQTGAARAAYERLQAAGFSHPSLEEWHLSLLFQERQWGAIVGELKKERNIVSVPILTSRQFWLSTSEVA